ncbi:ABC transporter ATP-binding protein [Desulfovibrio desulfuricans]|uniref:ABC transporter ATP-binding protein n=1 Tax=Desulfovibrio desulfuricans TaxID=876 RepID=UPI001B3B26F1|nr:ABC transporter ATP-binding protein [Desulfovibrio desulfuricans]
MSVFGGGQPQARADAVTEEPNVPTVLEVRDLRVVQRAGGQPLVHGVSFTLAAGACLGIVGESGSGKTLTCRSLMGLLPPTLAGDGGAIFNGIDLVHAPAEQLRQLRGSKIAMVLQQPMTAFDPLYTMGVHFRETLAAHGAYSPAQADALAVAMFGRVRLEAPREILRSYPHELSGGMLQRCMIALALALEPQLIIADEPTTALDAETQFEVVQRFQELRVQCNTSMIFVSHDLGVVQRLADAVLVMKDGRCVEYGPAETVFNEPQHEYTQYLIRTRLALTRGFESMLERTHA